MNVSSETILNLSEGADVEIKAAQGRDGQGELPKAFWPTYSAMANTDGGVILLGIKEVTKGWHDADDADFMASLGVSRRDRDSGTLGLTLGGLLMLGRLPAIQEAVPHYMLDYQERPAPKTELRWVDRVTTDGEWSGNLFDFCRIVLRKLYKELPVPFQLAGATRVDESPVHVALREALVNTLIHADFTGRVSILVVKRPDLFGFRNPGSMRVSLEEALVGGISDCRNRVLQRLFRMAGYAEQAGQGIPTIYAGWRKQLWRAPILHERRDDFEQTLLTMPVISLLSKETVKALEARFGARYRNLPETQQMALATVAVEGRVSHARLKTMCLIIPVISRRHFRLFAGKDLWNRQVWPEASTTSFQESLPSRKSLFCSML